MLQTMGNVQHICTFCQSLSQIFGESLLILLQILNNSYKVDSDCTEVGKQMTIFNNYRFWESYDIVPKQRLLHWMDKKIVDNFYINTICMKYSVYTTFNCKIKWKWYTTSNIQQITIIMRHFRKLSSHSSDCSEVVSCAHTNEDQKENYQFCTQVLLIL
jgi:hypothetical protein